MSAGRVASITLLSVLVIAVFGFAFVYGTRMFQATVNDPQTVAGPAQIVGAATPAQTEASVTTGAKTLSAGEKTQTSTSPGQPASPAQ